MAYRKHLSLALLSFAVSTVHAGGCLSAIRDPDAPADQPITDPWAKCPNDPPPAGWACLGDNIRFPTLDCIRADIVSCGNIGSGPTVFYSFGVATQEVRENVRDKLDPRGMMFNDALDSSWWDGVTNTERFGLADNQARQAYLRNIYAAAMAQASAGEVFLVTASRTSAATDPEQPGIFQNPLNPNDNIWREFELPNLQRNDQIDAITNVAKDEDWAKTTDWRRGDDNVFPLPDIDPNNPPAKRKIRRYEALQRRDDCPMPDFD